MIIEIIGFIVLVALDQWSKYMVVMHLAPMHSTVQIWPGVFELYYVENPGAAFGILGNGTIFLSILVFVIVGVILYFKRKVPRTKKYIPLHILTVFILAGAVGNLIDRIRLKYVVDMFHFYWFEFPVFNMADVYVTCSAVLLMILLLTKYKDLEL